MDMGATIKMTEHIKMTDNFCVFELCRNSIGWGKRLDSFFQQLIKLALLEGTPSEQQRKGPRRSLVSMALTTMRTDPPLDD